MESNNLNIFNTYEVEMENIESSEEIKRDHSKDHPDVTVREKWAWYMYDFATQPFSSAGLAIFIPLILEDLAWRAGTSDMSNSMRPPCIDRSTLKPGEALPECFVEFGSLIITPVSYALYISAISVVIQVVTFLSFGALADYGNYRKMLLLIFTTLNAVFSIAFLFVIHPSLYWLAGVLTILSNVLYGTAMVFYNAFLPLMVDADPRIRDLKHKIERDIQNISRKGFSDVVKETKNFDNLSLGENKKLEDSAPNDFVPEVKELSITDGNSTASGSESSFEPYTPLNTRKDQLNKLRDLIGNELSTKGFMLGYIGGVIALLLFAGVIWGLGSQTYNLQICVAACGIWTLIFAFGFTATNLKPRPGPSFPVEGAKIVLYPWQKTYRTIQNAMKLKNTFLVLISWFFYSDAYSTIATTAVLFGKSELNMTSAQLLIIAILAPLMAVPGNILFLAIYRKYNLSTKSMVLLLLILLTLIPLWGLIGFIPGSPVGAKSAIELYIVGGFYGLLLGALQSFSRVLYAELIPPSMESEFFSLYEITDRGSSWFGPLMVGVFSGAFGNVRYGFFVLIIFLAISWPILWLVDPVKGRKDAKDFEVIDIDRVKVGILEDEDKELRLGT